MSGAAGLKKQFESVLGGVLEWQGRPAPELVRSGVPEVDLATGGLPRGCLTEIFGAASSGRTSLLAAILAEASAREEVCALVDAEDAFDPASAAAAGVRLDRLLWVRCRHNAEHALQAADLLVQGGGFGLVAMDFGDTPPAMARRISLTSWFRLRRAVEHTPTVLLAVARQSNAKTCASLMLECARGETEWGRPAGPPEWACGPRIAMKIKKADQEVRPTLLRGIRVRIARRKPGRAVMASFFCGAHLQGTGQAGMPAPPE
jgi:hypothetical protein